MEPNNLFTEVLQALKRSRKIRNEGDIATALGYTPSLISEIKAGRMQIPEKILNYLEDTFNVNRNYLLIGDGEPFKKHGNYLEQRRDQKLNHVKEGIPVYEDAPYTLGAIESYRDVPIEKADFWVTIPGLRNCNYGVRATGDSMYPLIRNHALVVGEEITDTSFIPSGDIYIIRAKNGLETIKYIQPHETDPKKFVLAPYNEKAKCTDIFKKDILKIWKAKAVFNVL